APLLRYHALEALAKGLCSAGRALTDQMVKDLHKNMRAALLDRALPVQRAACSVLSSLFPKSITKASDSGRAPSTAVLALSDIDGLMTQIMKSLENPEGDKLTRLSLAQLTAHILSSTQIPRAVT
ncbi:9735_t:CDS:1, partial [Acaulospora colombiana]